MLRRVALVSFVSLYLVGTACAGQFRASAVKVDITPTSPQWLAGYGARHRMA